MLHGEPAFLKSFEPFEPKILNPLDSAGSKGTTAPDRATILELTLRMGSCLTLRFDPHIPICILFISLPLSSLFRTQFRCLINFTF